MVTVRAAVATLAIAIGTAPADARVNRWDTIAPHFSWLIVTARCESGTPPNWRAVSPGGKFRGGLQFATTTWRSVGGRGDPAAASRTEQLYRGALLLRRSGRRQWPFCGQH